MRKAVRIWLFIMVLSFIEAVSYAQTSPTIVVDAASLAPVNVDAVTGLALDPIAKDRSNRPCARIKLHVNRMTPEDISRLEVRTIGGSVLVMKQLVAHEGNGLIIELTAKPQTRFYLHHDRLGDSNPVTVALEGDKEYRMEAWSEQKLPVTVFCPKPGAEVYLDGTFRGHIGADNHLTILDVTMGPHTIEVKSGADRTERHIDVSEERVFFNADFKAASHLQGFIVFKVEPADALVELDGEPLLIRDGVAQKLVKYGTYSYKVSAKGCHSESGQIIVDSGKISRTISLRPSHGWIEIKGGNVDGAYVYIDSELVGQAPLTSDQLSSGTHDVRIVKPMFRSYETKVRVSDGETVSLSPVMSPDYSDVTLVAEPGVDIWVNGEYKGTGTWQGELPVGDYIIESRKKGFTPATDALSVTSRMPEAPVRLSALEPLRGVLSVSSSPIEADIYCNGELMGQTPLFLNDLPVGTYVVKISKDGYMTSIEDVTVTENEVTELNVTLQAGSGESIPSFVIPAVPEAPPAPATANCYIVSSAGTYSFPAVKGNTSESVGFVEEAVVLWELPGTSEAPSAGSLIASARHKDGLIIYETPDEFREGNAVIAAKDAAGRILWSWHIWLTDMPEPQIYARGAGTMMDRNLGAVSAAPGDEGSAGLLYQWGRKDPFPGSEAVDWPSPVRSSSSAGTVAYVVENPTVFITNDEEGHDWMCEQNDSLWQSSKTMYDPCPAGWRVPDGGSFGVWRFAGFPTNGDFDAVHKGMSFLNNELQLWYPAAGCRSGNDGRLQNAGAKGFWWTITTNGHLAYCFNLNENGYVNISFNNHRSYAFSVRCVQE